MRAAGTLLVGHLIALAVVPAQTAPATTPGVAEGCALAFELLAVVSLAMTAVFRALLPRSASRCRGSCSICSPASP